MRFKVACSATVLAAALAVAPFALSPARAETGVSAPALALVAMRECASGFHPDAMGNCQPDNLVLDSRCPPGLNPQVFPNGQGYRCVPYED